MDELSPATAERDIDALHEGVAPVGDRLNTALFLTAAVHLLVLLGVTFGSGRPAATGAPGLDVVLLPAAADDGRPNPDARYLSQATQRGRGLDLPEEGVESGLPLPPGSATNNTEQDRDTRRQRRAPAVLVASTVGSSVEAAPSAMAAAANSGPAAAAPVWSTTIGSSPRLGGPRRELDVRADTQASGLAPYLDRWRHHVEDVGTSHYPVNTLRRGHADSNPVLEVQILADGTLGEVQLRHSSGDAALDRAALAILRLSTPFEAFPGELRAHHDALRLSYEWEFGSGRLQETRRR